MNENLPMGGLNPKELKEALQGVADEYCEGVWALEYIAQLEGLRDLWIEYLTGACLYSDAGVEIPEELSGELDIGLPLARKICKALGGE